MYAWIREKVECTTGHKCVPLEQCPAVQRKYELSKSSKGAKKEQLVKDLRRLVCDRDERLICCEQEQPESDESNWLPSEGACGLSQDQSETYGGSAVSLGEYPFTA